MWLALAVWGPVCLWDAGAASGAAVTFTLSLNPADDGAMYENYHKADAGTDDVFVIGFQIDFTAVDGEPTGFPDPFTTFCTELEESIGTQTYTFEAIDLKEISRGRAGESGTASSNIPQGGIGAARAARVRYFFDEHYTSTDMEDWTVTRRRPETQAFQLVVWELTHDDDLDISDTDGAIYLGSQSERMQRNGVSLAQEWLDEIAAAGIALDYASQVWDVWALEDVGTPGAQDVLFATPIGSEDSATLDAIWTIPEPGTTLSLSLAALLLIPSRRRATG